MLSIHSDLPSDSAGGRELPFAERFRLIRQAGFDSVLIWWDEEEGVDFRTLPTLARRAGLQVENVHASFDNANDIWEDTAAGQAVFAYYKQCITDCANDDIPTVVMHTGRMSNPLPPLSEVSIERWQRLIDTAERLGVHIAIENQGDPNKCERAMELLARFPSPNLGMCYDSGHANVNGNNGRGNEMLAKYGHRLKALHLHDNDGSGDQHRMPFDGTIQWPALMQKIKNTGYTGPTTLELDSGYPHLSVEAFLQRAFACATKLEELRR